MKYVFDPEILRNAAKTGIGLPHPDIFQAITLTLDQHYPGKIQKHQEWFFNNAGGAMGMLSFLYASPTEYLIFYGSPTGTSGHTGRYHFVEDYAFIIDGEFWYATEGNTERVVCRPGDVYKLSKGGACHYKIPDNGWILEYARGNILTMLPFGFIEVLTQTLDWRLAFRSFRIYGKQIVKSFSKN